MLPNSLFPGHPHLWVQLTVFFIMSATKIPYTHAVVSVQIITCTTICCRAFKILKAALIFHVKTQWFWLATGISYTASTKYIHWNLLKPRNILNTFKYFWPSAEGLPSYHRKLRTEFTVWRKKNQTNCTNLFITCFQFAGKLANF